jgi:hypothetical protein
MIPNNSEELGARPNIRELYGSETASTALDAVWQISGVVEKNSKEGNIHGAWRHVLFRSGSN